MCEAALFTLTRLSSDEELELEFPRSMSFAVSLGSFACAGSGFAALEFRRYFSRTEPSIYDSDRTRSGFSLG
jgi:hypothetical protein